MKTCMECLEKMHGWYKYNKPCRERKAVTLTYVFSLVTLVYTYLCLLLSVLWHFCLFAHEYKRMVARRLNITFHWEPDKNLLVTTRVDAVNDIHHCIIRGRRTTIDDPSSTLEKWRTRTRRHIVTLVIWASNICGGRFILHGSVSTQVYQKMR